MKMKMRCLSVESQQATEVIPARQLFYTLLGAKLSLCETLAQSWMTARGQWSRYVAPPLCWKLPKGRSHITAPLSLCSHPRLRPMKMSHKVTIWLPKEYKRAAWLGSPQLLVDSQHSNISHTFITFYKYVYMCIFSGANSQLIYL